MLAPPQTCSYSFLNIPQLKVGLQIFIYTLPLHGPVFYARYLHLGRNYLAEMAMLCTALYCAGLVLRGVGRVTNPAYLEFSRVLFAAQRDPSAANMALLRKYDFEFWAWPAQFKFLDSKRYRINCFFRYADQVYLCFSPPGLRCPESTCRPPRFPPSFTTSTRSSAG